MSSTPSQSFRAQSSSTVISIPTRYDGKSRQHVIRWKDIQLRFKDAQYVLNGENTVLFLTDDDLEDLTPLRIAHHPGVVLKVVDDNHSADDYQGDSRSMVQLNDRDVASLRIRDADNNQALVVRSQGHLAAIAVPRTPESSSSQYQQATENSAALQEQIHQLQQQIAEGLEKMQQTDQQTQRTQRQMQDQIDKILQTLQQMDQQHMEEGQRMAQQSDLHKQQLEEALHTSRQQMQQQIETVQQKVQQLDQDSHQLTQDTRLAQKQIDKVITDVQQLSEHTHHSREQCEQLLEQIRGMGKAWQEQDHSSPDLSRQETQQAFGQFAHAQYLIQTVLAKPSSELPIPRLFIILPAPTTVIDGQKSRQPQFRLYFLCECGSHTMTTGCNEPHQVHLANHSGYDLLDQDEFIKKYGPYLLTMMYMVKYGVKTRGLVVPPLLGLTYALGESDNIVQLIDDTITHLKGATGCIDGDTTVLQDLDTTELTNLKSHLKIKDGECLSGGLIRMKIQKGRYMWICNDHLRECYESALQQLKHIIEDSGVWDKNEAKVNVTSRAMTRLFYDDLGKLFWIQSMKNRQCITESDLKLDTLGSLHDLNSLSLDFGRFTMSAKDIFGGEIKDMVVSIRELSALTLDDLEFIQQCRPTTLTISEKPPQKNDDRLINILQSCPSIANLRIDCDKTRHVIIDLVRSTRVKMLQSGDFPALRILELVHYESAVKVLFDQRSTSLGAETLIKFEEEDFIRQYGCSVRTIIVPGSFNDHHLVKLLDESTQEVDSRITRFDISPASLTSPGLDALSQVISRSQGLTYLRLCLENLHEDGQMNKALLLLGRHKDRLTSLRLEGKDAEEWLPRISQAFPAKDGFPALEELFVDSSPMTDWVSSTDRDWLASVVSASSQPRIPLKVFGIRLDIYDQDRSKVIMAIDLSTIEELHFGALSFQQGELKLLVDRIVNSGVLSLPIRVLDLKRANYLDDNDTTRGMLARIQEKVPQVEIRWK